MEKFRHPFKILHQLCFALGRRKLYYIHLVQGDASFPERSFLLLRLNRPSWGPVLPFLSLEMIQIYHQNRNASMDWLFPDLMSRKCPHSNLFKKNLGAFSILKSWPDPDPLYKLTLIKSNTNITSKLWDILGKIMFIHTEESVWKENTDI